MFTIKFYEHGTLDYTAVNCVRYSRHYRDGAAKDGHRITITVYDKIATPSGVEFHLGQEHFATCFIENHQGKTIDKIVWESEESQRSGKLQSI